MSWQASLSLWLALFSLACFTLTLKRHQQNRRIRPRIRARISAASAAGAAVTMIFRYLGGVLLIALWRPYELVRAACMRRRARQISLVAPTPLRWGHTSSWDIKSLVVGGRGYVP